MFVRSPRVGRFGFVANDRSAVPQTFDLFAFQTRHADGSWTIVGRALNRWEWDRFPELWNVVKGDLELVGVKPLPVEEATLLHEAWHQKRYEHPPGLTGLWYIQTGPESSLDEILVADAYYVATHTWRDDLLLLLRTPMAWLRRRRPHQVQNNVGDNEYSGQMDNVSSS
jgi:lipopolysaccharide/colanic/teichoic acid biosynthesis glycosyltransferase